MDTPLNGRRTHADFSKHIVVKMHLTDKNNNNVDVYSFHDPESDKNRFGLIIGGGITAVAGSFGNWIFSDELDPTSGEKATHDKWVKLLERNSFQHVGTYAPHATEAVLQTLLDDETLTDEEMDFLELLGSVVEKETTFKYTAFHNATGRFKNTLVKPQYALHERLVLLMDGYDALCEKLQSQQTINEKADLH